MVRLLHAVPALEPLYAEHLEEYGEALHHAFMGDVTRWLIQEFRDEREHPGSHGATEGNVSALLGFVDHEWRQGDPEARELISASFLENLYQARGDYSEIKKLLSPALLQQLERVE